MKRMKKRFYIKTEFDDVLSKTQHVVYSYKVHKLISIKEVSCDHYDQALKWKFDYEEGSNDLYYSGSE